MGDVFLCRLTEELVKQIKLTIRKELSARHVPSIILEIADIPVSVVPIISNKCSTTYYCQLVAS